MTQPRRISWFVVLVVAAVLLATRAAAQNSVTPTVKPTPPGQLIVVNNAPGFNHLDPHVDGDLVCYIDQQSVTNATIHYHDLNTGTDNTIPPAGGSVDFLCDVRGTTIVFTRSSAQADILTFDTSSSTLTEIAPQANSRRYGAQIGDQTIVWEEFPPNGSSSSASIVAYDRGSQTTTGLTPASPPVNQNPAISPDGNTVVWEGCTDLNHCVIWKAIRSTNGTWNSQQLVSQIGVQFHPDTDGTIIAYSSAPAFTANNATPDNGQVAWQLVAGGTEQVLNLPVSGIDPSVRGGLIAFAYDATGSGVHQIAIYNVAANVLYNVTADVFPSGDDKTLNDISVTPDGRVRVVWQAHEFEQSLGGDEWNAYAYTFNLPVGDFSLSAIAPLTISAGGSGSRNVTVNPVNGFSSAVDLSISGQPAGVTPSLSANSVTPSGGNPATSILNVSVSPALAPTNFTLTVTGTSGTLTHSATADVTVTATTSSIGNLIGDLVGAGCLDSIDNALTSKLSAAQGAANTQTAINILTALKKQISAQAGKHIATACTIAGVAFNPVTVLLLDVQGVIDSLRVSAIPDPITGYVVDMNGVGVAGAAVSISEAGGNVVATATTDITGFYFFATMSVLNPNSSYTVAVTSLPSPFVNFPAPCPAFVWSGTGMMIGNFVLN